MSLGAHDILSLFEQESGGPLALRDIIRGLALRSPERRELRRLIHQLLADGTLARVGRSRYVLEAPARSARGTLLGYGDDVHFHPSEGGTPVPVPQGYAGRALHGDEVEAHPLRGEGRPAMRVVRVLGRSSQVILASFRESSGGGYVVPQDPRLPPRIYLEDRPRGVRSGDLVIVDVLWSSGDGAPPTGRARGTIGEDAPRNRFYRLLEEFSLPLAFPETVVREALALAENGNGDRLDGRVDLREEFIFTIDPVNAYDHDDAVSIHPLDNGGVRLGIHIADVSAAVESPSALDHEARARAMSIYLEEGVVPMFPEELTRDVLSLVPDEDRPTITVFVDLDRAGAPLSFRVVPALIRSARRLAYEEAERLLGENGASDAPGNPVPSPADKSEERLTATLRAMWNAAEGLRRRREARGALDLDVGEAEVVWGAEGEPTELRRRERLRSHRLIEEFMLLANEAVARYLGRRGLPLIYRVHEPPSAESLQELGELLLGMGYKLPAGDPSRALLAVLRQARGTPEGGLVTTLVLRSMRKAIYSERNVGHFALASGDYAHFTSPIRRYPDLTVHRAVRQAWEEETPVSATEPEPWDRETDHGRMRVAGKGGGAGVHRSRRRRVEAQELADVAVHATRREILGDQVERASFAQAAALYMRNHVGDEFEGVVSGFGRAGVYVRLQEIPVEGLIPYSSLGREHFTHIEGTILLRGDRSGRTFRLGDTVRVSVTRADPEARHIDFELLAHDARRGPAPSVRAHGARPVSGARRRAARTGPGARDARPSWKRSSGDGGGPRRRGAETARRRKGGGRSGGRSGGGRRGRR